MGFIIMGGWAVGAHECGKLINKLELFGAHDVTGSLPVTAPKKVHLDIFGQIYLCINKDWIPSRLNGLERILV